MSSHLHRVTVSTSMYDFVLMKPRTILNRTFFFYDTTLFTQTSDFIMIILDFSFNIQCGFTTLPYNPEVKTHLQISKASVMEAFPGAWRTGAAQQTLHKRDRSRMCSWGSRQCSGPSPSLVEMLIRAKFKLEKHKLGKKQKGLALSGV